MSEERSGGIFLVLTSLAGATLVLISTRTGAFSTIDSAAYVEAARQLGAAGGLHGSLAPATQFPPLFPAVLSLAALAGTDVLAFARLLNASLFAGTIALSALLIARASSDGRLLPLLSALWIATSSDLLLIHCFVLSESLFIFLVSCWLLLLFQHLETPRSRSLLLASVAAALAGLCRFIGIALPLAALPLLLAGRRRSSRRRRLDALTHSVVGGLPLLCWFLGTQLLCEDPAARSLGIHPPGWARLQEVVDAVSRWLLPQAVPFPVRAWALGLGLGGVVWFAVRARAGSARASEPASRPPSLAHLCGGYLVAYWVVLLASASFADADLGIGEGAVTRLLLPTYLPSFVLVVDVLRKSLERAPLWAWARTAALSTLVLLVGLHVLQAAGNVSRLSQDGLGFVNSRWRESRVIERVRRLPPDTLAYTNAPGALYLLADRTTRRLPRKYDPISLRSSPDYRGEFEVMAEALCREKGVVVFLRDMAFDYFPSEDELAEALPLRPRERDEIGTIYEIGGAER